MDTLRHCGNMEMNTGVNKLLLKLLLHQSSKGAKEGSYLLRPVCTTADEYNGAI